jgi:hypothetical protein
MAAATDMAAAAVTRWCWRSHEMQLEAIKAQVAAAEASRVHAQADAETAQATTKVVSTFGSLLNPPLACLVTLSAAHYAHQTATVGQRCVF